MSVLDKVVAAVIPSTTAGEINAIDLLKKDHDDVNAAEVPSSRSSELQLCAQRAEKAALARSLSLLESSEIPNNRLPSAIDKRQLQAISKPWTLL
jgi:hypothetical protein